MRKLQLAIKRVFDFCASGLGLIILSPLFLICVLAIKLDSEGPAFFLQERIGYKGRVFKIYKFRTMVQNAEHLGDGLVVKSEGDARITKVGAILRKFSLDELPQLINTLIGDMSIVGPRPPVTYHPYNGYQGYSEQAKKRFDMRPGITGLAQVRMRNSATWDERIKVDIEYVQAFSLFLDLRIMFATAASMLYKEEYTK